MQRFEPTDLLSLYPGPVMLYEPRLKWLMVLAGCLAFTLIGIWMVLDGEWLGWFPLVFFGLGVLAAAALLIRPGSLQLDEKGFEFRNLIRRTRATWRDTAGFVPVNVPTTNTVVVGYNDVNAAGRIAELNRSLIGRNAALPDTYGLAPEALAELISRWRERVLSGAA